MNEQCHCRRCDYRWYPRIPKHYNGDPKKYTPKECPRCKSRRWNTKWTNELNQRKIELLIGELEERTTPQLERIRDAIDEVLYHRREDNEELET